jgi:hypothetical protein
MALFVHGAAHAVGTNYTLPSSIGSGAFSSCILSSGTTYNCSADITLANNDTVTVTSSMVLNVTGSFSTGTNVTVGPSISIVVSGNISLGVNNSISGNLTALNGTVNVGNNAVVTGDVTANTITFGNSNSKVNGICTPSYPQCTNRTLSIGNSTVTEGNSGTTNATFTVTLSSSSASATTVNYATGNGTATGGASCSGSADYATSSGTLNIAAGATTGTITVSVCGDTTYEANETFTVTLSGPSGATLGTPSSGAGTITNDDLAPTLSISNVSVNEGNSGSSTMTFTVTQNVVSDLITTVNYASSNGTATGGASCSGSADYATSSGTLNIAAGATTGTVTVSVCGDTTLESDETLTLTLSSPGNATLFASTATGTIINDDTAVSGFNGCEATVPQCTPSVSGYAALYTKLANTAFSLEGVALKTDGTPDSSFSGSVAVNLLANSNNGVALGANNCPASQNAILSLGNAAFTAGRATISGISVANAYRDVRMRFTCASDVCGSAITACSSDNFAIRPISFTSITSTMTNTETTGIPKAIAGSDTFTLSAVTELVGYNGTPKVDNTAVQAHANAIQNGVVTGEFSAAETTGTATGTGFTYSEVGNFRFLGSAPSVRGVYDDTFTSVDSAGDCTDDFSNSLSGGKYGCKFGIIADSDYFGRFYPKDFLLTTGALTNRQAASCSPVSTFTYAGEQFSVAFTLTARNGEGAPAITKNYDSVAGFASLDGATIANFGFGAVDPADAVAPISATALSSSLTPVSSSGVWASGVGTFTAKLMLARDLPSGSFESFRLGIDPVDSDGVKLGSYDLDTTVPPDTNDHGQVGTTKIRFGRLQMQNSYGSELLDLPIALEAQYWSDTYFAKNDLDSCTHPTTSNIALTNYQGGLNASNMGASHVSISPINAGSAVINLVKPDPAASGSVDILVNLGSIGTPSNCPSLSSVGSTSAAMPFLSGKWCGSAYDRDPLARATFGIYKGDSQFIYFREVY